MATEPHLVDRASRLFTFLAKAQQLKQKAIRDFNSYQGAGSVLWFSNLPERHEVIWRPEPEASDSLVLSIERIQLPEHPSAPEALHLWLNGDISDASARPQLAQERGVTGEQLSDHPEIQQVFDEWVPQWDEWAATVRRDTPLRDTYNALFQAYVQVTQRSEELELILGTGLLTWAPDGHDRVRRHLFSVELTPQLDERTGRLEFFVDEAAAGLTSEFDMLDPQQISDRRLVRDTENLASEFGDHPLDAEKVAALAETVANRLHFEGRWDDALTVPEVRRSPVVSFAPAIIVRPRTQAGLVRALTTIAEQIREREEVPAGLLPLLDPDRLPPVNENRSPGALLQDGEGIISPLPLNDVQRKILERVDTHAQTLVQGPPGTGKTHTAAALLTHLLAQGQRVLVTAQTDRALHEVREKLPEPIRSLAVSVIGASRDDLADLRTAVDTIAQRSTNHDTDATNAAIARELQAVESLRLSKEGLQRTIISAREAEVTQHDFRGFNGTLAAIASQLQQQAIHFNWLTELEEVEPNSQSPLGSEDALEWLRLLRDRALDEDAPEEQQRRLPSGALPSPEAFADMSHLELQRKTAAEASRNLARGPQAKALARRTDDELDALNERLAAYQRRHKALWSLSDPWLMEALPPILRGQGEVWHRRHEEVSKGVAQIDTDLGSLPLGTRIELGAEPDRMVALASAMVDFLGSGQSLKVNADGSVKVGFLSPAVVKQSRDLFEQARVDGKPPSTLAAFQQVIAHRSAVRILAELATMWPMDMEGPAEDNPREIVEWHRSKLQRLAQALELAGIAATEADSLRQAGVQPPDWTDPESVTLTRQSIDAVQAQRLLEAAQEPLAAVESQLKKVVVWNDAAPCISTLLDAVQQRDHTAYADGFRRLQRLEEVGPLLRQREQLTRIAVESAPSLARAVLSSSDHVHWEERLAGIEAAFDWGAAGAWILAQDTTDINELQAQMSAIDQRLTDTSVRVATLRAWNHAVGPDRLSPSRRADLRNYSQQVTRLGKGTGKYANQRRAEIRKAMDRCRPAVPVWIMPIYRVAEQLAMEENAFDVVVVDEASQAGLEATLLQYLAPKIVVIGDNKQVSPSGVGLDQQQLRDLATTYLYDDRYKDTWQDPLRSLFDEAQMRYGGQLTLTEHRRCVPEIIGFSNRIAYEPDGIRLVPVRQFGADRLDPFVVHHVPPTMDHARSKVNRAEARALVDDVKACLADPHFAGKSMAVISLVGQEQAKYIESVLTNEVDSSAWSEHDLRVGTAPDFQGSERDVVFLSMVSVASPGSRVAALTRDTYVQRFNVAVSRAKDQVRLFHSITLEELTNKEDMRHHLLDYAYGVVRRGEDAGLGQSPVVPEDELVLPFDSLFEQRVYNRIADRGFTVIPQSEQIGYSIDLVVLGAARKLAVECDGDFWHGPEKYEQDLARQRELERCGWTFFRVRESVFYVDPAAALAPLWSLLDELGITPAASADGAEHEELVAVQHSADEPGLANHDENASHPESTGPTEYSDPTIEDSVLRELHTADSVVREETARNAFASMTALPRRSMPQEPEDGLDGSGSQQYEVYDGMTTPALETNRDDIVNGLLSIVSVEGPVCWSRLRTAYVQASGGRRVGRNIAEKLDDAIRVAVRRGHLIAGGRTVAADPLSTTLRFPDQPEARVRQLGPRTLDEVPAEELTAAMTAVLEEDPIARDDFEFTARRTLNVFGGSRLSSSARRLLSSIYEACLEDQDEESEESGGFGWQ